MARTKEELNAFKEIAAKAAYANYRAEQEGVSAKIAKQRAARLAREANGEPRPEPNPDARVAKRR